mgnify:CR=1 FL=1
MNNHDAQMVSDLMSDKEFMWQYYHKSDNKQDIYHWHRLAGKTEKQITDNGFEWLIPCLLYTSPSPRDRTRSRMPSSA